MKKVAAILHSHQQWIQVPAALHPCRHHFVVGFLDFSHSNRHVVVSPCDFNFHFPNNTWYWTPFLSLLAICMVSSMKCLFRSYAHFLIGLLIFLLLSLKSPLYNSVCKSFIQYVISKFSNNLWLLFSILLKVFFTEQFFNFNKA